MSSAQAIINQHKQPVETHKKTNQLLIENGKFQLDKII